MKGEGSEEKTLARAKLLLAKEELLSLMSKISAGFTQADFDEESPLDLLVTERIQLERTRKQLWQIEESLSQIEKGAYGICSCCGKPIPPKRLEALPGTNLCVICAYQAQPHARARAIFFLH